MRVSAVSSMNREHAFARFEPLPQRVERNRRRLWLFLSCYVMLSSVLVAVSLVSGVYLAVLLVAVRARSYVLLDFVGVFTERFPGIVAVTWVACVPFFVTWCLIAVLRPEDALLCRLRAIPVPTGDYRQAKSMLHDAAIASGMAVPCLALIPDDSVNAFVTARGKETASVGVTSGLLDKLTPDELRAVFAHLIARVGDGSARSATVIAELFDAASESGRIGDRLLEEGSESALILNTLLSPLSLVYLMTRMCLSITALIVLPGYRRAQIVTAECADSEGMLLTRDPGGMLGALEKVLPADNRPGTVSDPRFREDIFGALFFAWPTFSFADDPELTRIERMREVLGAAGA